MLTRSRFIKLSSTFSTLVASGALVFATAVPAQAAEVEQSQQSGYSVQELRAIATVAAVGGSELLSAEAAPAPQAPAPSQPAPAPASAPAPAPKASNNPPVDTAASTASATGNAVVAAAQRYIGVPYVFGGYSPTGFDCSGFTAFVYAQFGKSLPHQSQQQATVGRGITLSQAQAGDILVWAPGSGGAGPTGHVALYLGNGRMIQATPGPGVIVTSVDYLGSAGPDAVRTFR